ncbi:MAG: alpha-D-ribose 1-methylphosphonate 5-triphosphate diphosphatase [Azospirillaceae bacterium]
MTLDSPLRPETAATPATIANARIVTGDSVIRGGLGFAEGRISALGPAAEQAAGADAADWEGDLAIAGLIDLHTDHLERHFNPRPGVWWDPVAAAVSYDVQVAGSGITTVFDAVSMVGGGARDKDRQRARMLAPMIDGVRRAQAAGMLRAEHFLHLRCEITDPDVMALVDPFLGDPMVRFLSLMDHSPGQRQFADLDAYRRLYTEMMGLSEDEFATFVAEQQEIARTLGPRHRRALTELGHAHGLAMASHDDQTEDHVREARDDGFMVAEFPTTRAAAAAARHHGMSVLMGAPNLIRGGSHSGNVACAELAREGLLDILASDYVPGSLLPAAFRLTGEDIGWSLPEAVATVTANPARVAGLEDRGTLDPGRRADVIRVRPVDGVPVIREVWREGRRVA